MLPRKLLVALFAAALGVGGLLLWLRPHEDAGREPLAALPAPSAAVEPALPAPPEPQPSQPLEPGASSAPNERLAMPPPMGGGRGPRQPFAIRVIDANGAGVSGALVRAWTRDVEHPFAAELRDGRSSFLARFANGSDPASAAQWSVLTRADPTWGEPDRSAETDASGSCTLQLPRGRVTILATRGQQSSGPWVDDPWEALTPSAAPVVLALRPISQLGVHVVDALDQPVEGAVVYVWTHAFFGRANRQPAPARTDREGRCSFDLDAPVEVQVCAQRGPEWSGRHTAQIHEPVEGPLIVRLGTPCALDGTVLDPQGEPAAAAIVLGRGPSGQIERTLSADDGRFHLPVGEAGRWTLAANRGLWLPDKVVEADVGRDGAAVPVELRLSEPGRITGIVRWEDSNPAPDIQVAALSFDFLAHSDSLSPYGNTYRVTTTGDDGRFQLDGLPRSETYTVVAYGVSEPIDASTQRFVRAGQDLEIQVKRSRTVGGPLVGRVIDHETLEPIPVFSVRLTDGARVDGDEPDTVAWQSIQDDSGRFRLDTGRRRSGHLWVSAAGHEPTRMGPLTFSPDETTVEIALDPAAH